MVRDRADGSIAKRAGFTVTKRIGGAVIRNRLKRRLRALARDIVPSNGVAGADHVFIGRTPGIDREFALLRSDLIGALARIARA